MVFNIICPVCGHRGMFNFFVESNDDSVLICECDLIFEKVNNYYLRERGTDDYYDLEKF